MPVEAGDSADEPVEDLTGPSGMGLSGICPVDSSPRPSRSPQPDGGINRLS